MNYKTFAAFILIILLSGAATAAYATFKHAAFTIGDGKDINLFGQLIGNGTIKDIICISNCSNFNETVTSTETNASNLTLGTIPSGRYGTGIVRANISDMTTFPANLALATGIIQNSSIPLSAANKSTPNIFLGIGGVAGGISISQGTKNIFLSTDATSGTVGTATDHDLLFVTNSNGRMVINNSGNVGIGNTTPLNILSFAVASSTDPIADSWLTYSTADTKKVLYVADIDFEKSRQELRTTPVFAWKRTPNEPIRYGVIADNPNTPENIIVYHDGKNNTDKNAKNTKIQGIDLAAYVGWLHEQNKAQQEQIDILESRIAILEKK